MKPTEQLKELAESAAHIRENTENEIVSSMFEATFEASEPVEKFSTWLLVGAAATASFLLTNSDTVLPLLGRTGFSVCGYALCLSCFLGLAARMFSLRFQVGRQASLTARQRVSEAFEKHDKRVAELESAAYETDVELKSSIDMTRVLSDFYAHLPSWFGWMAKRTIKKYQNSPHIAHLPLLGILRWQSYLALAQSLTFLLFLALGFFFSISVAPKRSQETAVSGASVSVTAQPPASALAPVPAPGQ